MKQMTATGQTVDEAVQSALSDLHTTKDRVDIVVIDEGKKGIFGIFGSRLAVVKVTMKVDPIEEARNFLINVCKQMDINVTIETNVEGKHVFFNLASDKVGYIIGKRGQTLNALQNITQLVLNRHSEQFMIVTLDAENYRKRREESLVLLANRLANKAVKEKKEISLEPMPSNERRIIHSTLADNTKVKTYSVGMDPNRYLVIAPK
ncbi:protein jag [Caldibacillus lycopersici]|uniref:RNA-binding protein KhpB n=1 Tax=Perspicuibacillus lycopersici TaxID=1325689 RepID=A0AAE3LT45_9BACI|nr:RNA-binding cell elongation regulator Jag/EloR [Perspicuibacillus lycopersici]MCU9613483.1 protein jag [Perspicuibacillus lycopersici]